MARPHKNAKPTKWNTQNKTKTKQLLKQQRQTINHIIKIQQCTRTKNNNSNIIQRLASANTVERTPMQETKRIETEKSWDTKSNITSSALLKAFQAWVMDNCFSRKSRYVFLLVLSFIQYNTITMQNEPRHLTDVLWPRWMIDRCMKWYQTMTLLLHQHYPYILNVLPFLSQTYYSPHPRHHHHFTLHRNYFVVIFFATTTL